MTSATHIRRAFLSFFEKEGHRVLPSSGLVPHNDPTLMFANAGMNQFKNIFTGVEKAPNPPRATTSQKCVRAGGKHNDLDNVGYTRRHHTFFEMLGNFSFGDYFKEGAIEHAWKLLTHEFGLPKDKLYFTVYHNDDEAFNAWKKITGCSDDRILRIPTSDNFWSMGDTGPCGPCSEIFYDNGAPLNGQWALDANGHDLFDERYVEIWNLVFMQFEQVSPDKRIDLPKPCVDTGMGLERMAAVMQGKTDNYEIDLFAHLIDVIMDKIPSPAAAKASASLPLKGEGKGGGMTLPSHKVIADHLRSTCFLIADGVLPSNEGRGYVLRRIMRRAMRHAHLLGCDEPLMHKLVPALVHEMGDHYGELRTAQTLMVDTLKLEEERFKQTLERGLKLLDEEREKISVGTKLDGAVAFKLYDTFGFPLDLTEDILRGHNMNVDVEGFNAAMAEQKARARAAWSGSGDAGVQSFWYELKEQFGATDFLGYAQDLAQGKILELCQNIDGKINAAKQLSKDQTGYVLTNQTPFYAESGGQVGDTGTIYIDENHFGIVTNTFKPVDGLHVHEVTVKQGSFKTGDDVTLSIDVDRRNAIRANHSVTHLLHEVLRRQLGDHITQKGSLVADDRLRFDVSHPKAISREELDAIEQEVNRLVWQNSAVSTKLMTPDEAIKAGAMALFGEKYGDEVRVLSMGGDDDAAFYSVELCGGTHVRATGDIGVFKIISEGAVAAGVRRIEAVTRDNAYRFLSAQDALLRDLANELKSKPEDLAEKISKLQDEKKKLEKQLAEAKKQLAMGGSGGSDDLAPETINGVSFIGKSFADLPPKELRDLATALAKKHESSVIALASSSEGKASIIVASGNPDVDAPTLVRIASEIVGGQGGGGKPNFAQAGGPDGDKINAAIDGIKLKLAG